MASASDASANGILSVLPSEVLARLQPHLTPISLSLGKSVYEAGAAMSHLYFVTSGIISLLQVMKDGASAEIAVVGSEGVVGISMFMGGHSTPSRAVVQSAAEVLRLPADVLADEFRRAGALQQVLLRFTQALITQMMQTAVCNRHHSVEQQLCRWLLLSLDRLPSDKLVMTQELIANMLGVHRGGVTEAARKLQDAKLIRYARGHIRVLDRDKLERRVCECYALVKSETDRLSQMSV